MWCCNLLFAFAVLFGSCLNLSADEAENDLVQVEIFAIPSAEPPGSYFVYVWLNIAQDWHLYWKNPGDSGQPIDLTWETQDSATIHPLPGPVPALYKDGPLINYIYQGVVVMPYQLTLTDKKMNPDQVTLDLSLRWLICKEICLPGNLQIQTLLTDILITPKKLTPRLAGQLYPESGVIKGRLHQTSDSSINCDWLITNGMLENEKIDFFPLEPGWINTGSPVTIVKNENRGRLKIPVLQGGKIPEPVEGLLVQYEETSKKPIQATWMQFTP